MATPKKILIVDDSPNGRWLFARSLLRKFPDAALTECANASTALELAESGTFDAIIAHRAGELEVGQLVSEIRRRQPSTLVIATSAVDRATETLGAGATCFLGADKWLLLPSVVEKYLLQEGVGEGSPVVS